MQQNYQSKIISNPIIPTDASALVPLLENLVYLYSYIEK